MCEIYEHYSGGFLMLPLFYLTCGSLGGGLFFMKNIMQIFTVDYWKSSVSHFTKVKSITFMGLLMCLTIIISGASALIPFKFLDREISLTFIMWPIIGMIFGPIPTMVIAGIVDVLIFFIFPSGYPFYLGYTLTQMLLGFLSGLFFYKKNISITNIIFFKFLVNFGIHVGIESLFMKDIYNYNNEMYLTYVLGGAIKNLALWPLECIIIIIIMMQIVPISKNLKLIDEKIDRKLKIY